MTTAIEFQNITKSFVADKPVLHDISLSIAEKEFVCLIGPSGCGKSTLLKIIAGLEKPNSGDAHLPKNVSMVFQSSALLPWLSVVDNTALGLRAKHLSEKEIEHQCRKYLEMVGLSKFAHAYPRELSGGQRQRVGLARALAVEPQILLLDEPFSALDPKTTDELHRDILRIWRELHLTVVMVSHLIEEAASLADRVILMKDGKIQEIFKVGLPYPRRENGLPFHELVQKIRRAFFAE